MNARPKNSGRKAGRSRARRVRRVWPVIGLALLLLPLTAFALLLVWSRLPGPGGSDVQNIEISRGLQSPSVGEQLAQAGLVNRPLLMDAYLWLTLRANRWIEGKHLLSPQMSPQELAACLTRTRSRRSVQFSIPEGFDQIRVARRLETLGICNGDDFLAAARDPTLLAKLGVKGTTAEGYLFPATYLMGIDSEPVALITQWVGETRRRIEKLRRVYPNSIERLASQRGWGEHEILTLASIIEKETNHDDERPIIAGVFLNRLDDPDFLPHRMLQSDPTAIYGCLVMAAQIPTCAGFGGRATPAMLRDPQNPYNTYKHPGLPPGPIASPGEGSIAAVLAPAATKFYFFVAKNGRHVFTRSLDEHEAVVHAE